ncbi:hypothetical protein LT493_00725 [Streptomyces tricolor]|nr:hypothetical protein [Streptomyces tricolor]
MRRRPFGGRPLPAAVRVPVSPGVRRPGATRALGLEGAPAPELRGGPPARTVRRTRRRPSSRRRLAAGSPIPAALPHGGESVEDRRGRVARRLAGARAVAGPTFAAVEPEAVRGRGRGGAGHTRRGTPAPRRAAASSGARRAGDDPGLGLEGAPAPELQGGPPAKDARPDEAAPVKPGG